MKIIAIGTVKNHRFEIIEKELVDFKWYEYNLYQDNELILNHSYENDVDMFSFETYFQKMDIIEVVNEIMEDIYNEVGYENTEEILSFS